jgi:hypothetical protein
MNGHNLFLMIPLYVIGIHGAREAVAREERALAVGKPLLSANILLIEPPSRRIAWDVGMLRLE